MNLTMFGIPNCNTIKKARDWLEAHHIAYTFHNYKKDGIDASVIQAWCDYTGWKTLLNQRGTTWRKLSAEDKAELDSSKAVRLMAAYPSMIKRPVLQDLDNPASIQVGFNEADYAAHFSSGTKP